MGPVLPVLLSFKRNMQFEFLYLGFLKMLARNYKLTLTLCVRNKTCLWAGFDPGAPRVPSDLGCKKLLMALGMPGAETPALSYPFRAHNDEEWAMEGSGSGAIARCDLCFH